MSSDNDPVMVEAARPDMLACLTPLRLAANGITLDETTLRSVADAAWRAITRPAT